MSVSSFKDNLISFQSLHQVDTTQVTLSNSSSSRSSKLEEELNSFGRIDTSSLVTISLVLNIENKDNVLTVYQGDDLSRRRPCKEASLLESSNMVWIIAGAAIGIIVIVVVVVAVVTVVCVRRRSRQWSPVQGKREASKGQYLEDDLEEPPRNPRMISSPLESEYENADDLVRGSTKPTWVNTSRN